MATIPFPRVLLFGKILVTRVINQKESSSRHSSGQIQQPLKKPRGKELTAQQKEDNQKISSFRVRVEHAIGSIKRYRIVKDECRLRKNKFVENTFLTCAALHNFRLRLKPFNYEVKPT